MLWRGTAFVKGLIVQTADMFSTFNEKAYPAHLQDHIYSSVELLKLFGTGGRHDASLEVHEHLRAVLPFWKHVVDELCPVLIFGPSSSSEKTFHFI